MSRLTDELEAQHGWPGADVNMGVAARYSQKQPLGAFMPFYAPTVNTFSECLNTPKVNTNCNEYG